MLVKKISVALALFAFSSPARAVNDNQLWASLTAQGLFSEVPPLGAYFEIQTRASEEKNDVTENIARTALVFEDPRLGNFFAGTLLRSDSSGEQQEHRPWVQWSDKWPLEDLPISLRLRHEWRSLRGNEALIQRSRLHVGLTPKTLQMGNLSPLFSTELFYTWNAATEKTEREFSQIRAFAGLKTPLRRNQQFQFGYQHAQVISDGKPVRTNHTLSVNLNFQL